eukprot:6807896-Pyramimonas_sp.AAC.1
MRAAFQRRHSCSCGGIVVLSEERAWSWRHPCFSGIGHGRGARRRSCSFGGAGVVGASPLMFGGGTCVAAARGGILAVSEESAWSR